jgi:hypothetical protein
MSLWTISILDQQGLLDSPTKSLVDANVRYVMQYLDRFIDWKGTLDVVVRIKAHADLERDLGWKMDGIIPATEMSWVTGITGTSKSNIVEMKTGTDVNGAESDAGFTIYLGKDGTIRNYGFPVWLDPAPGASAAVPAGTHDFISIALHEVLHTLAFDQANVPFSTLGRQVVQRDGVYYFEGKATVALLGAPLAFDAVGHVISAKTPAYAVSGMMGDEGNYERNRWDIGRIELAVLEDLGFDVHASHAGLPFTDLDDKAPHLVGGDGADRLYGDFHANILEGGAGDDVLDGGAGIDTAAFSGERTNYTIKRTGSTITVTDKTGADGSDTLQGIERMIFHGEMFAFDMDGSAGKAYRIYQAAFDRKPDAAGIGYWMNLLDKGATLADLAQGFVNSAEFAELYGSNPSAEAFVTKLYRNVLHREPEAEGFAYWVKVVQQHGAAMHDEVLAAFSESDENVAQVAAIIGEGFGFTPYTDA